MSAAPRGVVFDLDGTLLDSMPLVIRAYQHALAPYLSGLSDAELLSRLGGPPERIFEQLLRDSTHVTGALRRLNEYAAQAWRLIEPFPGVLATLDALRAGGCRLGVWTGRERESTAWLLRQHDLTGRIDALVCGDDLDTHKPDPAGLSEVLRRLGVDRAEAVFVGDADVDVAAGAGLGVRTIFIAHGTQPSEAVRRQAWARVDTPGEAYARLLSLLTPDTRQGSKSVP